MTERSGGAIWDRRPHRRGFAREDRKTGRGRVTRQRQAVAAAASSPMSNSRANAAFWESFWGFVVMPRSDLSAVAQRRRRKQSRFSDSPHGLLRFARNGGSLVIARSEATKQFRLPHSGMVRRTRPGISRFPDVQLHIGVRCGARHRAALRADPLASPRNDGFNAATGGSIARQRLRPTGRRPAMNPAALLA